MNLFREYLEQVESKKNADIISFFATRKCQKIRKISENS